MENDNGLKTCGDCVHWHKMESTTLDVSQVAGECRHSPPLAAAIMQGMQMVGMKLFYPSPKKDFPACSQFEKREGEAKPAEYKNK